MNIAENINEIRKHLPSKVELICVSKFQSDAAIMQAYNAGERHFGESRVQELCGKYERLPKDICWHFIGHLQTNKVKYIVPFVTLIHSVDSVNLLHEIENQAAKIGRKINCLLQIHIATEENKFGFAVDELPAVLQQNNFSNLHNVNVCGLMGMASLTDNQKQIHDEYNCIAELFTTCKQVFFENKNDFTQLSLGMSHDYQLAIESGSTMVRIGSSIFNN